MVKEVLEEYKKYVIETMNESNLFNLYIININIL